MTRKSWQEIVERAEQYKAVEQTEFYLDRETDLDYPWEHAVSLEPGGSHRLETSTSVWFRAEHPSGIHFRWSFDVEPMEANGKGYYDIDIAGVLRVLRLVPDAVRADFKAYLIDSAQKVRENAKKYLDIAQREMGTAEVLDRLSREQTP